MPSAHRSHRDHDPAALARRTRLSVGAVATAVRDALADMLSGATVLVDHDPPGERPTTPGEARASCAAADGPPTTITVRLSERVSALVAGGEGTSLIELVGALPDAGVRVVTALQTSTDDVDGVPPAVRRAVRDMLAAEVLDGYLARRLGAPVASGLVAETIEYLVELSGSRLEAHDLTHGVIITNALTEAPRLELRYPSGMRTVKRAPLLFDGRRSVLLVDADGRARTEVQRHRFTRLTGDSTSTTESWREAGSLVAEATTTLGGVGFFLRGDRSIWTYVDGQPLLVRRGEHWTAFPVELTASIAGMIGGGAAASLVARAAFTISAQPFGAILAIVDDAARLDAVVTAKDRYDRRADIEPAAMRPETWLHHLIDADDLDEQTLARLATLDGATVLDRHGGLLAYGAIVTSTDSQHEGARTAAARTLSEVVDVVLKVSVDGDITIFRDGVAITTLLGHPATSG